ncbi:CLUMA_CG012754, isoform A [Clunio marinus]|uniref:CLUMA_CG012754, isoform A n=1 Tax=Clunio marinus TaxID=568069 RepID=A0A1J1IIL8_9DIPT|nr:CLUMA_CG012754, isoform A [Clunio marinus]
MEIYQDKALKKSIMGDYIKKSNYKSESSLTFSSQVSFDNNLFTNLAHVESCTKSNSDIIGQLEQTLDTMKLKLCATDAPSYVTLIEGSSKILDEYKTDLKSLSIEVIKNEVIQSSTFLSDMIEKIPNNGKFDEIMQDFENTLERVEKIYGTLIEFSRRITYV